MTNQFEDLSSRAALTQEPKDDAFASFRQSLSDAKGGIKTASADPTELLTNCGTPITKETRDRAAALLPDPAELLTSCGMPITKENRDRMKT